MLHTNELPLRHLIQLIDGKTTSDTGFSGPLGKMLAKVLTLPINPDYKTVNGPDLVTLPPDVVKDLSYDQKYGYKMVKAVTIGVLPMEMANCAIGLNDHGI